MLTKSQQLLLYLMKLKGGVVDDKTKFAKYQYFTDFIHYAFYAKPVSEDIIYTRQKQGPLSRNLTDDLEELKRQGYIKESPTYKYTLAKDFNLRLSADEKRTARFMSAIALFNPQTKNILFFSLKTGNFPFIFKTFLSRATETIRNDSTASFRACLKKLR